ncbi:Ubiquitin fusion degradation protein, partial [Globisporangium splendens]
MDQFPFELLTDVGTMFPQSTELLDECNRSPLHYALEQQWTLDKLSWLVDKSMPVGVKKDIDVGIAFAAAACYRDHPCNPAQMSRRDGHLDGGGDRAALCGIAHAASPGEALRKRQTFVPPNAARLLLGRATVPIGITSRDLATVPYLQWRRPSAGNRWDPRCLERLRQQMGIFCLTHMRVQNGRSSSDPARPTGNSLRADRLICENLGRSQGEPLAYQWFTDGIPVDGATQSFLTISQTIQPHNAGGCFCEVTNRKGSVRSVTMDVQVVSDQFAVDPSLQHRIPRDVLRKDDIVHRVYANAGAFLHDAATGAMLLLPPQCFQCSNARSDEVSNSQEMDVVIRKLVFDEPKVKLRLRRGEALVSSILDILPAPVPSFLRRVALWIPHSHRMTAANPFHELVVVRVDRATGKYQDFVHSTSDSSTLPVDASTKASVLRVDLHEFGAFAALARSLPRNLELEPPLEAVVLHFVRPRRLSTTAYHNKVCASLWIAHDRPDRRQRVSSLIERHLAQHAAIVKEPHDPQQWVADTLTLGMRRGHLLCASIRGINERIVYQWEASGGEDAKTNGSNETLDPLLTKDRQHHCVASQIVIKPREIMETTEETLSPFCALNLAVSVRKPSAYSSKKITKDAAASSDVSVLLVEKMWRILIPTANDAPQTPPMPQLIYRSSTHVVLEFKFPPKTSSGSQRDQRSSSNTHALLVSTDVDDDDAEERNWTCWNDDDVLPDESERAFPPYFYIVETAPFSETFWARYDRTW